MKKAAGYIRVSTPTQAREGESLDTQRQAIEDYCQKNGLTLTQIYADAGVSGTSIRGREGLRALLSDARNRQFELLVIHRLSRFGRNARELLNNVEDLNEHRVQLMSLKEGLDFSSSFGKALLVMLAGMAQLERDIIQEQMTENKLARWKRRETFIGKPP